jgi:hypothetical protein
MAADHIHPCESTVAKSGSRILAKLVIQGRVRISKVAAPEGRLFEAFHSCRSEHGMPGYNGGGYRDGDSSSEDIDVLVPEVNRHRLALHADYQG